MSAQEICEQFTGHYYNTFDNDRGNLMSLYVSSVINLPIPPTPSRVGDTHPTVLGREGGGGRGGGAIMSFVAVQGGSLDLWDA
jgi:hypothetical protein